MHNTFHGCSNFNQPIIIPNSVTSLFGAFQDCLIFNSPVTIGNNVVEMNLAFQNCYSFNQELTIPENVNALRATFLDCLTLKTSTVPIHISHKIAIGDTSNFIYNCLVNNSTGINWTGRILNDA